MYDVVLSRCAARALEDSVPAMRRRLIAALQKLRADPHGGKRLRGELEGLLSLRVGGLRIVYGVDSAKRIVVVHGIGPRGDIYKR